MKKLLSLFCSLYFVLCTSVAIAYKASDEANAQFLADENLIVKQSAAAEYRLDDTITRAEVVGIALKMKGVQLPEKYTCKNYYTDVKYDATNNWICRAVELAADNGLVTRANMKFRPNDPITKIESLGIMMESGNINLPVGHKTIIIPYFSSEEPILITKEILEASLDAPNISIFPYADNTGNLHSGEKELMLEAANLGIVYNPNVIVNKNGSSLKSTLQAVYFKPNDYATRADVFNFSKNIREYVINIEPLQMEVKVENHNLVLYREGKKIKNLTSDGNTEEKNGNGNCQAPNIENSYSILGKAAGYYIIYHRIINCGIDSSAETLIFNGSTLEDLEAKIRKKFGIQFESGLGLYIYVKNNQIQLFGEFTYIYDPSCDGEIGCPVYLTKDKIKSLGIHIFREPTQDNEYPGNFELLIDPTTLF